MMLIVNFGSYTKKEVHWYRPIEDFPKLIKFSGKKWEWAMYSGSAVSNYELFFSEIPPYDPHFYMEMETFEKLFEGSYGSDCQCGAIFTSFSWDHMRFCPKWVKW